MTARLLRATASEELHRGFASVQQAIDSPAHPPAFARALQFPPVGGTPVDDPVIALAHKDLGVIDRDRSVAVDGDVGQAHHVGRASGNVASMEVTVNRLLHVLVIERPSLELIGAMDGEELLYGHTVASVRRGPVCRDQAENRRVILELLEPGFDRDQPVTGISGGHADEANPPIGAESLRRLLPSWAIYLGAFDGAVLFNQAS